MEKGSDYVKKEIDRLQRILDKVRIIDCFTNWAIISYCTNANIVVYNT